MRHTFIKLQYFAKKVRWEEGHYPAYVVEILKSVILWGMKNWTLKSPSSASLILRLGQAAQKQQRPRCPNRKMNLEIIGTDERALAWLWNCKKTPSLRSPIMIALIRVKIILEWIGCTRFFTENKHPAL